MDKSINHKAVTGAVWAAVDRFGYMGLQFIVNLILANLLMPKDFGAIGMLMIFISVSAVLIDSGFGSALVQKKEPTQQDYSTVFYWNIFFSIFLYAILFLTAPLIANFYNYPILKGVLRLFGLTLILNAIFSIQITRLRKRLELKKIAICDLSSYFIASGLGIWLAVKGWGVWSLVTLQILYGIVNIITLFIVSRWHPSLCFSRQSMKELFGFGGYIMAASILQETCKNLQGIIIGKKFSATQMGYYSQASKLEQVSCNTLPQVIVQVMYPVYSSLQDDRQSLIKMLLMNIRVISLLVFPLLGLLVILAEPIITTFYGVKWQPSVPYFQVLCVGGLFACLQNINFYAVASIGKSKSLFYWSIYKWSFLLCALLIGAVFGMYGILWGMVASSLNIYFINALLVQKHIGLPIIKQIIVLLPVIGALVSGYLAATFLSVIFTIHHIVVGLCFFSTFSLVSVLFNKEAIKDTKKLAKKLLHKNYND